MAIGPIGRPVQLPPAPAINAGARQRTGTASTTPTQESQAAVYQSTAVVVRTYAVIRIDASNMVSVKVVDADTDEVLIEAPPSGLANLSDALKQATARLTRPPA